MALIFNVEHDDYFALKMHQTKSLNENLHPIEAEIAYKNTCRRTYNPWNFRCWFPNNSFLNFKKIARVIFLSLNQESFVMFSGKCYRIFIMFHLNYVRLCFALNL